MTLVKNAGATCHFSQINKVFILPQPFSQHFYNSLSIFPGSIHFSESTMATDIGE